MGQINRGKQLSRASRCFKGGWYASVTAEELFSTKNAIVSGLRRTVTHSGHRYSCVNRYPVCVLSIDIRPAIWLASPPIGYVILFATQSTIGECGGLMKRTHFPACGMRIGGVGSSGH